MVELPVHQPNVERIPTRDSSRSLAQQPTQQGNDSKVERIPSSKKLPITPEDIRPVVKVIKPETKDVLVQVDVSEREDNEYEIKVICKQDPVMICFTFAGTRTAPSGGVNQVEVGNHLFAAPKAVRSARSAESA
jgi:hypothetical protein